MLQVHDPTAAAAAFHVLLHAVLLISLGSQVLLIVYTTVGLAPRRTEIVMRAGAATAATMLFLGARLLGATVPATLLPLLLVSGAFVTTAVGTVLPALLGLLVAWFIVRKLNSANERKDAIGMRVLVLVQTLALLSYIDTYAAASGVTGSPDQRLLLPNLAFSTALLLTAVFRFFPLSEEPPVSQRPHPAE
jgi:hypothetical protein